MSLTPGSRLGGYEILSELGRGGMGVVWRARDKTLHREVAIKVLPDAVARDPDRLARFEREARVLASLNHPNVAHLYGFFTADAGAAAASPPGPLAVEAAPLPFLVMELVPGETLADHLARGRLSIDETIAIFLEIARGLEAAHARGVIHRDLKPANIKIAAEDAGAGSSGAGARVKILDFGLAKALLPDRDSSGGAALAESPTLTLAATQRGEVLGTAAYMSPEQARGRTVDERTDVWAFGVCLYEALAGRSPFLAEDAAGTLAKVLESNVALDAVPPTTPHALQRLLRRCLVRNPAQRLHHIADARLELEEAREQGPAGLAPLDRAAGANGWSRRSVALGAAVAIVLGVVLGAAITRIAAPRQRLPLERFEVMADGIGKSDMINEGSAVALAPGGDLVIAATRDGVSQLWRRRPASLELEPIVGTEGGYTPVFTPDGKWLTFLTAAGIMKVPPAGGLPERVETIGWFDFGVDWGEDGALVFADDREEIGRTRLWVVPANGTARRVTTADSSPRPYAHVWPDLLPGGRAVVFSEWEQDEAGMRLMAVEIESGEIHSLLPGSYPYYHSATGHLLFTRSGSLWAAPFDPDALELQGPAVRIVDDIATDAATGRADYAVGDDGTLVYRHGERLRLAKLAWIDAAGSRIETSMPAGDYSDLALSPDRGRVAMANLDDFDLWVYDLASDVATRLVVGKSTVISPAWSKDGRKLAFTVVAAGKGWGIYAARADGSAPPERLGDTTELYLPKIWIDQPPGLVGEAGAGRARDIVFLHLDGKTAPEPMIATPARELGPALSPDERWLAYESDESGQGEIYLRPFPELTRGRWQISRGGGSQAQWDATGDRIYYRKANQLIEVTLATGAGEDVLVGEPRTLMTLDEAPRSSQFPGKSFAPARDGQRFLTLVDETDAAAGGTRLIVVKNFASELPKLAPRD